MAAFVASSIASSRSGFWEYPVPIACGDFPSIFASVFAVSVSVSVSGLEVANLSVAMEEDFREMR